MRTIFYVFCTGLFLTLVGCQDDQKSSDPTSTIDRMDVIIEEEGSFPASLAGRWKADKHRWQIVFAPDGSITELIHNFGGNLYRPMHRTTIPLKQGGTSYYDCGRWRLEYSPATRELVIEITVDDFRLEMQGVSMEGKMRDLFVGKIDPDGQGWSADWYSFPDYWMLSPQKKQVTHDPDNAFVCKLRFTRAEDEK
ncbi:MAG: hypothetical protein JXA82_08080 [Sedimentisphaerales bacterium]|nr:hypothetical protein [Sedimentisphaerales bacterium]